MQSNDFSKKGLEFVNSEYNKIKKVYSIWVCTNPPKTHKNTITRYKISEENVIGNVKEDIIISKEGNDLVIGFNSKYLIDALKVIEEEQITMLFNTSISPCLIRPVTGENFEYLILPVRITGN